MPKKQKSGQLSEEARAFFKSKKMLFAAWACENKTNDSYQVFYPYMKELFGKTIIFDPQKKINFYGKDRMNRNFLEAVRREKPDYIFLWLIYEEFYPETLANIKAISPETKVINFFGDDDTQFETFTRYFSRFVDYQMVFPQLHKEDYEREKIKDVFFTCMINTEVFRPLGDKKKYDLTFVGTPKSDRAELLSYLKKNGINMRIFGWGWEAYPEFKEVYGGALDDKDFVKVINQSKINLCLSKNYVGELHIKGRTFNVGACKSFVLVEHFKRYFEFLKEDKEIVTFKDKEELLKKVRYYLEHSEEREEIAENAYKKIINNYSLEIEFAAFFQKLYSERNRSAKKTSLVADGKVLSLKIDDLNSVSIKDKLKDIDYVTFSGEGQDCSEYRNYFQIYSIKKSKKPISCCDYYINSQGLGDYLLFPSSFAFKNMKKEVFIDMVNPPQIMVENKYFVKNLDKFRDFARGKRVEIIDSKNTTFVGIPLVRVRGIREAAIERIDKPFFPTFEIKLKNVYYQRMPLYLDFWHNLLFSSYPYKKKVLEYLIRKSADALRRS